MPTHSLHKLAAHYGIYLESPDEKNVHSGAADSCLISCLQAAGLDIAEPCQADSLLKQVARQHWEQILDPVSVLQEDKGCISLPLRLPVADERQYQWTIIEESKKEHHGLFRPSQKAMEVVVERDGQGYGIHQLDLQLCLPCGYHNISISRVDESNEHTTISGQLIVVPRRCYVPSGISAENRVWGVSVPLHAVRSKTNWGIGDFSDLKQLLAWAATHGASTIHTPPLYDLFGSADNDGNPYAPSCRTGLNVLYLDVEAIPDFLEDEEVGKYCLQAGFQARLASLRNQARLDYDAVIRLKGELFKKLWNHFYTNHLNPETSRGADFRHFQAQGGKTLHYSAIFAAIAEELGEDGRYNRHWNDWPVDLRSPFSKAVASFTEHHEKQIEYYQYLQWQAALQMATIGHRSLELGLKIGLLQEFLYGIDGYGFESWYYNDQLFQMTRVKKYLIDTSTIDPAVGLPLFLPHKIQESCYQAFIEGLRHIMFNAGAVIIRSMANYFQASFSLAGDSAKAFIRYPFSDFLGILALESIRNRCLVIADDTIDKLPKEQKTALRQKNIFSNMTLFQFRDTQTEWRETATYPANSLISTSPPFLASMQGFWQGRDIAVKTEEGLFPDTAAKEKAILARSSDRAKFLINLAHVELLPEGYDLDPAKVLELDWSLISAGQMFLAKTPAKILLVAMGDLLQIEEQAEPPSLINQSFWTMRLTYDLETIVASQKIENLFKDLCQERGLGVVRPSAPLSDRRKRQGMSLPTSFYRLQLNRDFTFVHAAAIIPYLKGLGVSHCYISPLLMARPGSPHGYDIINHTLINPEIGSRADFEMFIEVLEQHQMALLLDIVPNHMGIGPDNNWWMDVLENGRLSLYANFFDINWQPQSPHLSGRVLLPVLGDHYGNILDRGELTLCFCENSGSFSIHYYEHRFPVAPKTCQTILAHDLARLGGRLGLQHTGYLEMENLISSFENLPDRHEISEEKIQIHQRDKDVNKRRLARLCREQQEVSQFIEENIILFNGERGKPESYDLLHDLLEKQAYRLAFWRVAGDEINYRRFFDINDLAGLRMEDEQVFHETHNFILDLIATGKVDGLRVDHPDGLYDPLQYFSRLQTAAVGQMQKSGDGEQNNAEEARQMPLYVVAEKILADFESLPEAWPVSGTTGYDFSNHLNGILLETKAEKPMTSLYHQFVGKQFDLESLLYNCKKLIIRSSMAGELNVLASQLYCLAQADRATRDFTFNRLRDGLIEVVAYFPVYRTYITPETISKSDSKFIEWAVAQARDREQSDDLSAFDFIKNILLSKKTGNTRTQVGRQNFISNFQQYTGPVMAKGLEDTSFYIYNRLLSLNEVGGSPQRFGVSVTAFHRSNQDRLRYWPHGMLNSSTHDSKRSEDVRSRINILTEMVPEWKKRVFVWSKLNRSKKTSLGDVSAPDENDEYAFYQNLIGVWPTEPLDEMGMQDFLQRIITASVKACREAKVHTSWINQNQSYEDSVARFVKGVLTEDDSPFMTDFLDMHQDISWFGLFNSLSQVFLKLVAPGIPDIYQGCELLRFSLVDPDNRRPVDFQKRQDLLFSLFERMEKADEQTPLQQELLADLHDGRAKMYTIVKTLQLRNAWQEVFDRGSYLPLEVTGTKSSHVCAFARKIEKRMIIAVAPRLYMTLMHGEKQHPIGTSVWGNTAIVLPNALCEWQLTDIFSSDPANTIGVEEGSTSIEVGRLLQSWPVALLQTSNR